MSRALALRAGLSTGQVVHDDLACPLPRVSLEDAPTIASSATEPWGVDMCALVCLAIERRHPTRSPAQRSQC
jgi:hypothetical protein